MNTAALREQIQKAQQHEAETGLLTRQLESKLPHLHSVHPIAGSGRQWRADAFCRRLHR